MFKSKDNNGDPPKPICRVTGNVAAPRITSDADCNDP